MHSEYVSEGKLYDDTDIRKDDECLTVEEWKMLASARMDILSHCNEQLRELLESLNLSHPVAIMVLT